MRKIFFTFFNILILFCYPALAQTHDPLIGKRCSYNEKQGKNIDEDYLALPERYYPWGVCVYKPDFLAGRQTTSTEDEWITEAINTWNTQYVYYKVFRWGDWDVVNIPPHPLFILSCDSNRHNIIYVIIDDLGDYIWGEYRATYFKDRRQQVYSRITIHNDVTDEEHFKNIMIHELGHALGITHLPPDETNLMQSQGFGCSFTDKICSFTLADFDSFLGIYDFFGAMTREEQKRRAEERQIMLSIQRELACIRQGGMPIKDVWGRNTGQWQLCP